MFIAYVDHIERLKFFLRFKEKEKKILFITCRLSIYLLGKLKKINISLVKPHAISHQDDEIITKSRDYLAGFLSFKDAMTIESSINNYINNFEGNISGFLLWNGSDVAERTINKFSVEKNIPTIFLEIANLPGKIFIDPLGTNAKSALFKIDDLSVLKNIRSISFSEYESYIEVYKKEKSGNYKPPQSKIMSKINYYFLLDYLGSIIHITPRVQSLCLRDKISTVLSRLKGKGVCLGSVESLDKNYLFLPLQVSNDSQVLLNSSINNIDAIQWCVDYCSHNNLALLVKIHPAEKDSDTLNVYQHLSESNNFKLVTNNTNDLIVNATKVVTINSTVGFESKLLGIDTIFLGDSFYDKFESKVIPYYINCYLFDCDYFGDEDIDFNSLLKHFDCIRNLVLNKGVA
ncbi:hypothetical protein RRK63_001459 [Vibrio fluvialis]|nr:hypothetical protein [Vibrio fluvialis]